MIYITYQVVLHGGSMEYDQMDLTMIFNGKGCLWQAEHQSYHPNVNVYFQKKARADRDFCVRFAEKTIKPWAQKSFKGEEWLLFLDNLDSQKSKPFVDKIAETNGKCVYGPSQRSEGWQPIHVGHIGATLKSLGKDKFEAWMERTANCLKENGEPESNWEKWRRNGFSAKEKRILCTWVFGQAWEELRAKKYFNMRRTAFEKGGCAITLTGTS